MMTLKPGHLTLPQLRQIARAHVPLKLDPASHAAIDACAKAVADIAAKGEPAYGINTGFGRLASTHIPHDQLELLQRNLVLSHAVGVGEPMSRPVVRLLIALKLSSLGRGRSGIRREVMEALITLYNADVLPVIPVKGSVGASGDLAPLAHMSAVLLGVGEVFAKGERLPATEGLALVGLKPPHVASEGRSRAAERHAGIHGARALQHVRDRRPVPHRARGGRVVGGCSSRLGEAVRRAHSRPARPSRTDRRRRGLSLAAARLGHQRIARRLRQGAGPVQPALPAASDGRVSRSDASCRRRACCSKRTPSPTIR